MPKSLSLRLHGWIYNSRSIERLTVVSGWIETNELQRTIPNSARLLLLESSDPTAMPHQLLTEPEAKPPARLHN